MEQTFKKKYRVIYNRAGCIEVLSCVAAYPNRWRLNDLDRKADLVGGKIDPENPDQWILDFTEEELAQFEESALVCPARVISIVNIETGEKIV